MTAPLEIAVLDMEWTAWEGSWERGWSAPGEFREVIEIGLIALTDDADLTETRELQFLVTPTINPDLSDYFINLTGITQARVDADGVPLRDAVGRVEAFLAEIRRVYSMGRDGDFLLENCAEVDIASGLEAGWFLNVMPLLQAFTGEPDRSFMSSRLPQDLGFEPPGQAHTALADCRCIAEALRIMRRAGAF